MPTTPSKAPNSLSFGAKEGSWASSPPKRHWKSPKGEQPRENAVLCGVGGRGQPHIDPRSGGLGVVPLQTELTAGQDGGSKSAPMGSFEGKWNSLHLQMPSWPAWHCPQTPDLHTGPHNRPQRAPNLQTGPHNRPKGPHNCPKGPQSSTQSPITTPKAPIYPQKAPERP